MTNSGATIGALEAIARSNLPTWLAVFRGKHPSIAVRLKIAGSGDLIQQVAAGAIDVAFCFDQGSFNNRLAARLVFKEPMILIVRADSPVARHMPTLSELSAYDPAVMGFSSLNDIKFQVAPEQNFKLRRPRQG